MSPFTGLFGEMRSGAKDFIPALPRGKRARQLGLRAAPALAAAAAATGGLCIHKRRDPPDTEFLGRRAAFWCTPWGRPGGAAAAGEGIFQSPAARQRALVEAGADLDALRRAAQRLRGPIERDLAAVECLLSSQAEGSGASCSSSAARAAAALGTSAEAAPAASAAEKRKQLYRDLVEAWKSAGYFAEPAEHQRPRPSVWDGYNPLTAEDETYGRDIGCEVPLCFLSDQEASPELRSLQPQDWASAAEALDHHGAVLLRDYIPQAEVCKLRTRLHVLESALDARARRNAKGGQQAGPIREYNTDLLQEEDPELEFVVSTPGRRHFYLRGRQLEQAVREIQAGAMPLIWEHLSAGMPGPPARQPYVSEVQLLITDPCATDQFWHIDNSARGLTLFVPLTPLPEELGPNVFLPGTHHLFEEEFTKWFLANSNTAAAGKRPDGAGKFISSLLGSDGLAVAAMESGDALLYDSRLVHRGAANRRYDRACVALVFRYDFERPPGFGPVGTFLVSWSGIFLAGFQRFYSKLPSL